MVDLLAIKGTIGAAKAALDIIKATIGVRDAVILQDRIMEMNDAMIAVQAYASGALNEQEAQIAKIRELGQELARFETWETEKQRYQLEALPPGAYVYTLKTDMADGEPTHHICQACYQNRKKSILNQTEENQGRYHLTCNECGADLIVGNWRSPLEGHRGGSDSWMG